MSTDGSSVLAARLADGSWAPGGVDAFRSPFSSAGDDTVRIVGWALEHLSPLDEWLDELTGEPDRVTAQASSWRAAARALRDAGDELVACTARVQGLEGRTGRALRKRLDDVRSALASARDWAEAASGALDLASTIVEAVRGAVIGALSEIAGAVVDLGGLTLNPLDRIDAVRSLLRRVAECARIVGDLVDRMTRAFAELVRLAEALAPIVSRVLRDALALLGELVKASEPLGLLYGPPGLVAGIVAGGVSDLLAGDPRVEELDPDELGGGARLAWDQAQEVRTLDSVASLVAQNGRTDSMGGEDRSVVDVKRVIAADGTEHWVVSLPSTQDWDFPWSADAPATNDLDSNVALILLNNPALRTQYERAVMQAMTDAGVPVGADVVYTGFSQGGIMAASIASHDTTHNTVGIVTNGAPIGTFAIPPSVRVLSFEHVGDPVPLLDGTPVDPGVLTPNRTAVELPPPPGGLMPDQTHNNINYTDSVAEWERRHPDEAAQWSTLLGGRVVDHQMHAWSE